MSILIVAWSIGNYYRNTELKLFSEPNPPTILNVKGSPQNVFKPGDSLIIQHIVIREPLSCWASYYNTMTGPVNYQFPETRSVIFVDKPTKRTLRMFFTIPENLPEGEYKWSQFIYPICEGQMRKPYESPYSMKIIIKK